MNNWIGFIVAAAYIFGLIGLAETLRRWRGYGPEFTRKIIHIGAGMVSWALPYLFDNRWPFIIISIAFVIINYLDWRFGFFIAMSTSDRSNLGTVYFPIVAIAAALMFWDRPPLMVAAVMPLTWGDGLASVIGRSMGRRHFYVAGHERTLEGSGTFLLASSLFTWMALWMMPGMPDLTPLESVLPALVVSGTAAIIEAVSIWGVDNLTISGASILILAVWLA